MKKRILIYSSISLAILAFAIWYFAFNKPETADIVIKPTKGLFKVTVTTTGELQAKNSIEIQGPASARTVGIWQMKITRLVPEGSVVKTGDFVAELDKSEITGKIKDIELNIQKFESQYLQAKLDSTLNLSNSRDELENLKFNLEEKKLLMEQSAFEPPAIIRQAEIDYERIKRQLEQSKKNYETKVKQAVAKLSEVNADLSKEKQKMANIMAVLMEFTIMAPSPGLVIYAREWNGNKKVVGSTISSWDPVVATLPDLDSMESITYVNEVDIQKIKVGQFVKIGLDANPDKKLTGKVTSVANIGEQKRNSDSKVFEVKILINEKDSTLLPSMTTGNEILIETIDNSIYIPLECVHTDENGGNPVTYIFKKNGSGIVKQEVQLGTMNENEVTILKGLSENEDVYITIPENAKDLKLNRLTKK